MTKKERFNKAYEWLLWKRIIHKQEDVAVKMGSTQANISSALKGNPRVLTDNFLKRFCFAYQEHINIDWLMRGEGDMIKEKKENAFCFSTASLSDETIVIPAWADSLISLVSANTSIIQDLKEEIKELKAINKQLLDKLHVSAPYIAEDFQIPRAAENNI